LIGRENLGDGEIKNGKIGNDEIEDNEKNVKIADCEKFFLNYIDRCAISIYFANLIIDRAAIEIASTY
jgi:hypothetical protein